MADFSLPETEITPERQKLALDYLWLTRSQIEKAYRARTEFVKLARKYGLTNQKIGDALGISEARVRQIGRAE